MKKANDINKTIVFLLEISMLIAFGYFGYRTGTVWFLKLVLAIFIPAVVILFWGRYLAPRSNHRLGLSYRVILTAALFFLSALAWYRLGHAKIAIMVAALTILAEPLVLYFEVGDSSRSQT